MIKEIAQERIRQEKAARRPAVAKRAAPTPISATPAARAVASPAAQDAAPVRVPAAAPAAAPAATAAATAAAAPAAAPVDIATVDVSVVPKLNRDGIRKVQLVLREKGFDPGGPAGTVTARMKTAVRGFQERFGLKATGELDNQTLLALGQPELAGR